MRHVFLADHSITERVIWGVSFDGGPITRIGDHRLTEKEARNLATNTAQEVYHNSGTIVTKIHLHRLGLELPAWTFHEEISPSITPDIQQWQWTPAEFGSAVLSINKYKTGSYETLSYNWTTPPDPTLFALSDGEYVKVGFHGEDVVELNRNVS
jgi:hypothetical protein